MRIHLGADHAALDTKDALVEHLRAAGHDVVDHGPHSEDPEDDYPVYVLRAAEGVRDEPGSLGIVLGGSGNGEQMAANKVKGVRAALGYTDETARLAREHNNAQILSIGARMNSVEEAKAMADLFVATPFSEAERHLRRLAMLDRYEETGELPPLPDAAR